MGYQLWSDAERAFIRNNAGKMTDQKISDELTRITGRVITLSAVRRQRHRMGIAKKSGRGICELKTKESCEVSCCMECAERNICSEE